MMADVDDPRAEADERTGRRFDVRVLEPSPPAVLDGTWFADDPVHRPGPSAGEVVAPVPGPGRTWDDLIADDPALADWCADRWLGARRRLEVLPPSFAADRERLHRAAGELSEARRAVTGKLGLRWVRGGFGTPWFGDGEQRRVDAPFVGELFGFGTSVLEELRVRWAAFDTRVQLWPEHFDLSIDAGPNVRATYGISPGDDDHPEPYLYVAPWERQTGGGFWSDPHFGGAALAYDDLLGADDQRAAAIDFFTSGWDLLAS